MNVSGSTVRFTTTGAASAFLMKRVIPIPSVVKAAVPSISVAMRPGSVDARTCTLDRGPGVAAGGGIEPGRRLVEERSGPGHPRARGRGRVAGADLHSNHWRACHAWTGVQPP